MKLNAEEKKTLAMLKAEFKELGGVFAYVPELGATVAVLPTFKNSDFVQVASAYADLQDDRFKKSCGQYLTLIRLQAKCSIVVKRCDRSDREIAQDVLNVMCAEYY